MTQEMLFYDAFCVACSDRHLVFGNHTGINLHGDVVLGSEDVATDWMMVGYLHHNQVGQISGTGMSKHTW